MDAFDCRCPGTHTLCLACGSLRPKAFAIGQGQEHHVHVCGDCGFLRRADGALVRVPHAVLLQREGTPGVPMEFDS